ncbi:sensor histidine kinase [Microbacterium sp. NPDC056569]|uniref:sensor histidine kinase n=1 Tax=Microbacterium sp. NPDC056569 TaxID=3345867 RepID=UPI00366A5D79
MDTDHPAFSVDTGLFRQLGELLVGRDATAVVELVKNAYDADATTLILIGSNLDDADNATIEVIDNGNGMTAQQFARGFLRLAARSKTEGTRRSSVFLRRFTGEKGVGRLAAHKLGALLHVETVAAGLGDNLAHSLRAQLPLAEPTEIQALISEAPKKLIEALIDWDQIEMVESVADIDAGLSVAERPAAAGAHGTKITIGRMRHAWSNRDLAELGIQLENFSPPKVLIEPLSRTVTKEPVLFTAPRARDVSTLDPGMTVELQGDFSFSEQWWPDVARTSDWILEIRADRGGLIEYAASPTVAGHRENAFAAPFRTFAPHPAPEVGPFFDARVFLRPGIVPGVQRGWSTANSGVRVYLEGFRVLPYGEAKNDWLSLDLDYTRRSGKFELDPSLGGPGSDLAELRALKSRDLSLRLQPNRNFFGAVFLTEAGSGGLRSLVNREGFVPDEAYERLVQMVRTGIDLLHRAWALAGLQKKKSDAELAAAEAAAAAAAAAAASESSASEPEVTAEWSGASQSATRNAAAEGPIDDPQPDADSTGADYAPDDDESDPLEPSEDVPGEEFAPEGSNEGSGTRLVRVLDELGRALEQHSSLATEPHLKHLALQSRVAAEQVLQDASLLRVLASVGSQLAAFTHEMGHLVPIAMGAEEALAPRPGERWPARAGAVRDTIRDLTRAIERQAAYLTDFSSSESRARRTRMNLRERVDIALLATQTAAASRAALTQNRVPETLTTPPLFKADLQSILSNLLSNATKAVNQGGMIAVDARTSPDGIQLEVSNTGTPVDVTTSDRLFLPYVSDSKSIDPTLSQGMGLGLPITRQIVSEYGGTVMFVGASAGFATTIQVRLPA